VAKISGRSRSSPTTDFCHPEGFGKGARSPLPIELLYFDIKKTIKMNQNFTRPITDEELNNKRPKLIGLTDDDDLAYYSTNEINFIELAKSLHNVFNDIYDDNKIISATNSHCSFCNIPRIEKFYKLS
jgi:hypothetical protein